MMHPEQEYFDKCVDFFERIKNQTDPINVHVEKVPIVADWLTPNEHKHVYTPEQQSYIETDAIIKRAAKTQVDFTKYPMPLDVAARFRTIDGRYYDEFPLIAHNLYLTDRISFRGWKCMAGIDGLFINERGYISRAACLPEMRPDGGVDWLGRINNMDNFQMPRRPIICNKDACYCITDIIMGKER